MGSSHFKVDARGGVTVLTVRDGLFDAMPEMAESVPLVAEVVGEFRSAIAGQSAVVVDLRQAGEVNKRTLSVSFQFAHALTGIGARRALCGSAGLKQIWELCRGGTVAPCFEELEAAIRSVGGASRPAEPLS